MNNSRKEYDVIVIGAGLAGLSSASLLSKRGLKVLVIDKSNTPGGSCGVFKRHKATFDQGSSMLYGFGEKGFNAHRFLFNCLEEPIDMIQHDLLYVVNYEGHRIHFHGDIDLFIEELSKVFPDEKESLKKFYADLRVMYHHIFVENPTYTTPDESSKLNHAKGMLKHPISYFKFLSYLNSSAESLLRKYFKNEEIFNFFDKMTSTYCYATVEEAPAVLASVMFIDNHIGGSYYPAGSTLFLPGKLEKVIEENNGTMLYETEVKKFIIENNQVKGVITSDNQEFYAKDFVYSGTVWNLYENMIDHKVSTQQQRNWSQNLEPTYPSIMMYAIVDKNVIDEDASPIEMLVGNPKQIDESEVTVYILSIDDQTLCAPNQHVLMIIGPSLKPWHQFDSKTVKQQKLLEKDRISKIVERRFPGFKEAIQYSEIATPETLFRYTHKRAVAGPKQMLGQHMFKRLKTKSEFKNLYYCGESTAMGTGTPTVTTSGIAASNAILKKRHLKAFVYEAARENVVNIIQKPVTFDDLYTSNPKDKPVLLEALRCQFCEKPTCFNKVIPDIMRRLATQNIIGAKKQLSRLPKEADLKLYESRCILSRMNDRPIQIESIINFLEEQHD